MALQLSEPGSAAASKSISNLPLAEVGEERRVRDEVLGRRDGRGLAAVAEDSLDGALAERDLGDGAGLDTLEELGERHRRRRRGPADGSRQPAGAAVSTTIAAASMRNRGTAEACW